MPDKDQKIGLVILNPAAGDGDPEKVRETLKSRLGANGFDLHETAKGENLREVVQTAVQENAYGWVAAVGGDGTVSQVADGLVNGDIPLAIIPAGTGNVLARSLGIPQEIEAACELITKSKNIRKIDSLQVGQHYYFLQLGIGLESATMKNTSAEQKNRWGMAAYVWTLVKEIFGWQPHRFRLTVDEEVHHIQASELVIANASQIGIGNLAWDQKISPDDGQIDIVIVEARSLLDYAQFLATLLRRTQRTSDHIHFLAAFEKICVEAESPLPIHGDGEVLGEERVLEALVNRRSLKVIVSDRQ